MTIEVQENLNGGGSGFRIVEEEGIEIGHVNDDVDETLASLNGTQNGTQNGTKNGTQNGSHKNHSEGNRNNNSGFLVKPDDLSRFAKDRNTDALIELLEKGIDGRAHILKNQNGKGNGGVGDIETPSVDYELLSKTIELIRELKKDQADGPYQKYSKDQYEMDVHVEQAVEMLTALVLRSSLEKGIDSSEAEYRRAVFGSNAIAEKPMESFLALCWEAVQDFVLIMLIVLGIIALAVEISDKGPCGSCWAEGTAILLTVLLVVLLTASIDYAKQFAFQRLARSLFESNTKQVIRNGKQMTVIDDDIVVGDILCVNSHALASVPADCVLIGPAADLKMDESTLTGESEPVSKKPGDVILSGTNAIQGSGRMVVIAVGINSVGGKIRAHVYESTDHDDELGDDGENSPLYTKLDKIAKQIGIAGIVAACFSFVVSCIIGLGVEKDPVRNLLDYLVTAITSII
ncbi:unnamed protein product [Pseudo-nitzschia multistriata]|uniref:Cation-transporting P-type ATPase N-terminal domain-containing protein n=1 Tax=Pseudo-nitzschia multistriata TaxID=183589 RepID=A0A448ZB48_9STRA|nr:unnamed protein product [Pseudo-nitzschia multistriata]